MGGRQGHSLMSQSFRSQSVRPQLLEFLFCFLGQEDTYFLIIIITSLITNKNYILSFSLMWVVFWSEKMCLWWGITCVSFWTQGSTVVAVFSRTQLVSCSNLQLYQLFYTFLWFVSSDQVHCHHWQALWVYDGTLDGAAPGHRTNGLIK